MKQVGDPLMYPCWKAERKLARKRKYKSILMKIRMLFSIKLEQLRDRYNENQRIT